MRRRVVDWLVWGLLLPGFAAMQSVAQGIVTTTVSDTVYRANGLAAGGTVLVSWPAFVTATGASVGKGSVAVVLGTGGALSVALAPNAGATPAGSYYTVVYHLDDGSTSREYWTVPASGSAVRLSSVRASVLPTSVAMQTASVQYVQQAIAAAALGSTSALSALAPSATVDTTNASNITSGVLAAARVATLNQNTTGTAANVTGTVAIANGGTGATSASGARAALGLAAVAASGSASDLATGTLPAARLPVAAVTGGSVDGTTVGVTTPASGVFTTAAAQHFNGRGAAPTVGVDPLSTIGGITSCGLDTAQGADADAGSTDVAFGVTCTFGSSVSAGNGRLIEVTFAQAWTKDPHCFATLHVAPGSTTGAVASPNTYWASHTKLDLGYVSPGSTPPANSTTHLNVFCMQ